MAQSTSNSPELTQEQVVRVLTQPLEAASVFLAAGPRIFDTAGPLRIPKMGGPITDPGWTGENELIPERDVDFDEVQLLPSTMESVKVITRYSNELARQSVVSLDQAIRDRLVRDVASKIDTQLLSAGGDGVSTPKGLFAYAGQTVDTTGGVTLDHLVDAWGVALASNLNMGGLKWVLSPANFTALRKVKDGDQRYMLQPDPTQDSVFRLFGTQVVVTSRVPAGFDGALVDFSQIAVARDVAPSVKILTERYADYDQQAIRVVARYDAAPLNDEAIITLGAAE